MAALLTVGGAARAQPAGDGGQATIGPAKTDAAATGGDSYWSLGISRFFVSSTIDIGYLYFRPQIAFGYGRPHWSWIGAEIAPGITSSSALEYAGLHAASRYVDVRAGGRYVFSFSHRLLQPRASYDREDIDSRAGAHSRYVALSGEVSFTVPLPAGRIFGLASAYGILGVPTGEYVFEEALHTVIKPPLIVRGRLGYSFTVSDLTLGAFGEIIENPGRGQPTVRVGPTAGLQISDHLDLFATFAFVAAGPDTAGLTGGDLGTLGVRYRWASGEAVPLYLIP
ncbi:MAG: hypothetical protein ABJE95_11560 [Byssovorax sp.]